LTHRLFCGSHLDYFSNLLPSTDGSFMLLCGLCLTIIILKQNSTSWHGLGVKLHVAASTGGVSFKAVIKVLHDLVNTHQPMDYIFHLPGSTTNKNVETEITSIFNSIELLTYHVFQSVQ
jgi:hypothetical protein